MNKCTHDLAERETACADGMCPICLKQEMGRLREILREIDVRYQNKQLALPLDLRGMIINEIGTGTKP